MHTIITVVIITILMRIPSPVDIDECTNGVAQCSHICHNKPGSFQCSCLDGFKLTADNQTCDGMYLNEYDHLS